MGLNRYDLSVANLENLESLAAVPALAVTILCLSAIETLRSEDG